MNNQNKYKGEKRVQGEKKKKKSTKEKIKKDEEKGQRNEPQATGEKVECKIKDEVQEIDKTEIKEKEKERETRHEPKEMSQRKKERKKVDKKKRKSTKEKLKKNEEKGQRNEPQATGKKVECKLKDEVQEIEKTEIEEKEKERETRHESKEMSQRKKERKKVDKKKTKSTKGKIKKDEEKGQRNEPQATGDETKENSQRNKDTTLRKITRMSDHHLLIEDPFPMVGVGVRSHYFFEGTQKIRVSRLCPKLVDVPRKEPVAHTSTEEYQPSEEDHISTDEFEFSSDYEEPKTFEIDINYESESHIRFQSQEVKQKISEPIEPLLLGCVGRSIVARQRVLECISVYEKEFIQDSEGEKPIATEIEKSVEAMYVAEKIESPKKCKENLDRDRNDGENELKCTDSDRNEDVLKRQRNARQAEKKRYVEEVCVAEESEIDVDDEADFQDSGEEYEITKEDKKLYEEDKLDDIDNEYIIESDGNNDGENEVKDLGGDNGDMETDRNSEQESGYNDTNDVKTDSYSEMESGDDEDDDGEGERDTDGKTVGRKRRRHPRKYKGGKTKHKQKECPECRRKVVNVLRHLRVVHGENEDKINQRKKEENVGKKPPRQYGGKKQCGICKSVVLRMDTHLIRVHKLKRGTDEFVDGMETAEPLDDDKAGRDNLSEALDSYAKDLDDRASGKRRSSQTSNQHCTAVRTFLKTLTHDSVQELNGLGKREGEVNKMLENDRLKPETIKIYLGHLASFLEFLASNAYWCRHLLSTPDWLKILANKMRQIARSLTDDINRARVKRSEEGEQDLEVEPWMVGRYMGERPPQISGLMAKEILTSIEETEVRDSLCLQLLLDNFKRAGDISHLKVKTVMEAEIPEGEDSTEVFVAEHKEAKSGKKCPIRISSRLLLDLQTYITTMRMETDQEYVFLTKKGKGKGIAINPSNMSKLLNKEWKRFAESIGEEWPKLTASINRKLAVTTIRELGVDRKEQEALALHMAHRVSTADKYYDKSVQSLGRQEALKKVTDKYAEAAAAKLGKTVPARKTPPRKAKLSPAVRTRISNVSTSSDDEPPVKKSCSKRYLPF